MHRDARGHFYESWVLPSFAYGYLALSDEIDPLCKCTDLYSPKDERAVRCPLKALITGASGQVGRESWCALWTRHGNEMPELPAGKGPLSSMATGNISA